MNIRERLQEEVANHQRKYEAAIRCSMMAIEDLQEILDVDFPFYANVYAYRRGAQVYVNDSGVTARLAKDPRNEELREAVAAFNGFVSAVMDAAGTSELKKRVAGTALKADIYLEGRKHGGVAASHFFSFTWQGACEAKKYRVTKTEEIVLCGDIDASQYDTIEEITEAYEDGDSPA